MRASFIFFMLCAGIGSHTSAQHLSPTILTPAGNVDRNDRIELEWTIGEVATEGITNQERNYTEGFHQPVLNIEVLSAPGKEKDEKALEIFQQNISIAPNPVSSTLIVTLKQPASDELHMALISPDGMSLSRFIVPAGHSRTLIQLSTMPSGIYVLQVRDIKGQHMSSYRISKIQ